MSLNTITPEVVKTDYKALLGEGPVWDEENRQLWWVDILNGRLMMHDPVNEVNTSFNIEEHLGAAALREDKGFILALQTGFAFFDTESEQVTHFNDPEEELEDNRFNDGKCDPAGRFWAGTMSYNIEKGAGSLYCLYPDQKVEKKVGGITISNGMAWDTDNGVYYFIDSMDRTISAFDYEIESGRINNRRIVLTVPEGGGLPDGMTIDRENKLWVALYDGGKVIRVDPATGEIQYEILLPVPKVTSCTFGGTDLHDLYITTAREHMSEEEIREAPLSGSLFKATLPFQGKPAIRYGG